MIAPPIAPAPTPTRRRLRLAGYIVLVIVTLGSLLPVFGVVIAGVTASLLGCDLDEGSVHPCLLAGTDIGGALYFGSVFGWMVFVTAPFILLSLAIWLLLLARWLLKRLRRRGAGAI